MTSTLVRGRPRTSEAEALVAMFSVRVLKMGIGMFSTFDTSNRSSVVAVLADDWCSEDERRLVQFLLGVPSADYQLLLYYFTRKKVGLALGRQNPNTLVCLVECYVSWEHFKKFVYNFCLFVYKNFKSRKVWMSELL